MNTSSQEVPSTGSSAVCLTIPAGWQLLANSQHSPEASIAWLKNEPQITSPTHPAGCSRQAQPRPIRPARNAGIRRRRRSP